MANFIGFTRTRIPRVNKELRLSQKASRKKGNCIQKFLAKNRIPRVLTHIFCSNRRVIKQHILQLRMIANHISMIYEMDLKNDLKN